MKWMVNHPFQFHEKISWFITFLFNQRQLTRYLERKSWWVLILREENILSLASLLSFSLDFWVNLSLTHTETTIVYDVHPAFSFTPKRSWVLFTFHLRGWTLSSFLLVEIVWITPQSDIMLTKKCIAGVRSTPFQSIRGKIMFTLLKRVNKIVLPREVTPLVIF